MLSFCPQKYGILLNLYCNLRYKNVTNCNYLIFPTVATCADHCVDEYRYFNRQIQIKRDINAKKCKYGSSLRYVSWNGWA